MKINKKRERKRRRKRRKRYCQPKRRGEGSLRRRKISFCLTSRRKLATKYEKPYSNVIWAGARPPLPPGIHSIDT